MTSNNSRKGDMPWGTHVRVDFRKRRSKLLELRGDKLGVHRDIGCCVN